MRRKLRMIFQTLRPARSLTARVLFSPAPCFSSSLRLVFLHSLLLKVGTSNPLLNLLNGAKPIYQLTHFRWIIYPFILSDNAADVTRGTEAGFFRGNIILSCSFSRRRESEKPYDWSAESCEPHKTRCYYTVLLWKC